MTGSLFIVTFLLSCILTNSLRQYALAKNIVDVPNHRSSHVLPTPRGGGVAFVVIFFMALPYLYYNHFVPLKVLFTFWSAGLLVAGFGFWDDQHHIPAAVRLFVHLLAGMVSLILFGGMPGFTLYSWEVTSGVLLNGFALLYIAWLINLYNFMDGIDGLASTEAVTVCISGAFLYWLTGHSPYMLAPLILAFSVAGFMVWNFPSAKIFMGDAGSGFLGLTLSLFSIQAAWVKSELFYSWLIMLGVFIIDATLTLLRRFIRGDKLHQAHKSHAYQHAAQFFKSHVSVTLAVLVINLFWLFPIAVLVGLDYVQGIVGLLIAYLPLILLASHFKAGKMA